MSDNYLDRGYAQPTEEEAWEKAQLKKEAEAVLASIDEIDIPDDKGVFDARCAFYRVVEAWYVRNGHLEA